MKQIEENKDVTAIQKAIADKAEKIKAKKNKILRLLKVA
jgi:hypothetical protein